MNEEWQSFFDGAYEVSSLGRVRRAMPGPKTYAGKLLKLTVMTIGYHYVNPVRDGKNVPTYVHHLVAEAFLGPRPAGADINHIDGDKTNNVVSNLEYVTHAENMAHARRIGIKVGRPARITDSDIQSMRAMRDSGARLADIAKQFRCSTSAASTLCNHKTWRRIT